ncbi:hypothetical protein [Actinomadura rubrisoli]|uniref:Uncharacterized protein n=1 Tax=Actinomadura rubrisoli TaxID=2530368 RepID=A0A4R5C3N9_9ACTN|nr:hypothetical protein [Actinomadura rubrisoli]TDD93026.1 hypothetical protein E1298_10445 [Actinomadura rubrisoli]
MATETAAESETRDEHAYARLGALMTRLHTYDLKTALQRRGLIVSNPAKAGCCEQGPQRADTITCKPREDDAHRLWFYSSWGEPIAEADHIIDAAVIIAGRLGAG